ncbi:MAG: Ig-like domain-containing protein, partial [Bifidobacteriaceae bacterium]|nr:Ig-like domain-containing protein [Bifidobacteriaceae bacterium]
MTTRVGASKIAVLVTAVALALAGGLGSAPPARAEAESAFDIQTGSKQRLADGWRDFGTPRTFTRIEFTSASSQEVTFSSYDWEASSWTPFWASEGVVSGAETVRLPEPVEATKIKADQSGVTIGGVFNDSPLVEEMDLEITTTVGVPAVLPAKINVDQANGGRVLVPVAWEVVDQTRYWEPGEVVVSGVYGGGADQGAATVTVTVTAERGLIDVPTPYLGWNSWYSQFTGVSEASTKAQVEIMERQGLPEAGYDIIWIDEGWWGDSSVRTQRDANWRDADGKMIPNAKFPDMKGFADWLHARGLKLGLYTDTGDGSCAGVWGSGGDNWFEQYRNDVARFKEWGADAIKLDHCGGHNDANQPSNFQVYSAFYQAMRAADADGTMILDTCEWGQESPGDWAYKIAHAWRTGYDLSHPALGQSLWSYWERNLNNGGSRPGAFNDPDYLVLTASAPAMNVDVWRVLVSLWAFSASPMITSMDANLLTDEHLAVLTNPDILALDQDPLVSQPNKIREDQAGLQVWSRQLEPQNGKARRAIMLINESGAGKNIGFDFAEAGLANVTAVRDIWSQIDLAPSPSYSTPVFPNELVILIAEGDEVSPASGFAQYNYARLGKATSSSSQGSNSSGRSQGAIDGSASTSWIANATTSDLDGSQWVGADLAMSRSVAEAAVNLNSVFNAPSQLEYQDADGAWQVAASWASLPVGQTTVALAAPVTAQYWRWRAPGGGQPQVRELQLFGADKVAAPGDRTSVLSGGGANYLVGCVAAPAAGKVLATASTVYSAAYGADRACDGVDGTADTGTGRWNSGVEGDAEWLRFDLPSPVVDADKLVISAGSFWMRQERTEVSYVDGQGESHPLAVIVAGITTAIQDGELQGANQVAIDVSGLSIQSVRLDFTVVNSGQPRAGNQPMPSIWEVMLYQEAQPVTVQPVNVSVDAGASLELPEQVKTRYSDGRWSSQAVVWDAVDPALHDRYASGRFLVEGVVDGTAQPALAYVTVVALPSTLDGLQSLVDANSGRLEADYGASGWPGFEQALADAETALAGDPPPTGTQIVDLAVDLRDAVKALVDLRDLRATVADAEAALELSGCFEPGQLSVLEALLDEALAVLADPDSTSGDVGSARSGLAAAAQAALERPNLARSAVATASSEYSSAYGAGMVNDGNTTTTRWNAKAGSTTGDVVLAWPGAVTANLAKIYFRDWTGRAAQVALEYKGLDGQWQTLATIAAEPVAGQVKAEGITLAPFAETSFSEFRVNYVETAFLNGGTDPTFWEVELYGATALAVDEVAGVVTSVGVAPVLPSSVGVVLWDGTRVASPVVWDEPAAGALDEPGSFVLSGRVACVASCQRSLAAEVTVEV